MTDPVNLHELRPTRTGALAAGDQRNSDSLSSAAATEAQQIASQILAEAFSTLRIRLLKPEAIATLRAEVKRRVDGLRWARAA